MNNRAELGATANWMVATVILFFACIIFLFGALAIAANQKYSGELNEIVIKEGQLNSDIALQRTVESFLNKKVDFNQQTLTISQLIEIDDEQASKMFVQNADKIFQEIFDLKLFQTPWWFRVYGKGERIENNLNVKKFWAGGSQCNPEDKEKSLIISNVVGDKRVVLCVDKEYYKMWRSSKHE